MGSHFGGRQVFTHGIEHTILFVDLQSQVMGFYFIQSVPIVYGIEGTPGFTGMLNVPVY